MERQVKALDCLGSTIYRVIERRSSTTPWLVHIPCVDYDREEDAEWKLKEIERQEKQEATQ